MHLAASGFRLLALGAATLFAAGRAPAADPPPRASPSRPMVATQLPTKKIGGLDCVAVAEIAARLGLKFSWTEPGRKGVLDGPAARAEIEAESRDTTINGLRIFLGDPVALSGGQLWLSRIDFERCLMPLLRPGSGAPPPAAPRIIALDPGHGGGDPGTENKALGLQEKTLTLDVALRLKALLEQAGYTVVMTRSDDRELAAKKEVDLPLRADLANREHADLFVSIHFNAATKDTHGTEVFSLAPRTQRSTDSWGLHTDDSVPDDLPGNRLDPWNTVFAAALHRELLQTLKTQDRGKKLAHWAVLKTLNCPGVLVEPAIITNEAEARRVATPEFRQQVAEALLAGIRDYAATLDGLRPKL